MTAISGKTHNGIMSNLLLVLSLIAIFVTCPSFANGSAVQNDTMTDLADIYSSIDENTGLTYQIIDLLSVQDYIVRYNSRNSTSARDAYQSYATIKDNINHHKISLLPVEGERLAELYLLCENIDNTMIGISMAHSGGGTIYSDIQAAVDAQRAYSMGIFIKRVGDSPADNNFSHKQSANIIELIHSDTLAHSDAITIDMCKDYCKLWENTARLFAILGTIHADSLSILQHLAEVQAMLQSLEIS